MAMRPDRARRSLAVEVTVAWEAPRWLVPQVVPTYRPEQQHSESDQPVEPEGASQRPTREIVLVEAGFGGLEELTTDIRGDGGRTTVPLSGLYALVPLVMLFTLTLLAGTHVVELPETLKTELGMGLSALAVFTGLHALMHR